MIPVKDTDEELAILGNSNINDLVLIIGNAQDSYSQQYLTNEICM